MIERPGWFGPAGRELFGWYTAPESGCGRLAAILCSPIGEEEHNAHETFRRLARRLAEAGIPSMRFDHYGTGDSRGPWDDDGRVEAWLEDIAVTGDTLRAGGAEQLVAVGMRIGATLAAIACEEGRINLDALVLWDPCSGKAMLREGHGRRPATNDEPPEGAVDTPGYRYSASTTKGLRALDPSRLQRSDMPRRVLALLRDDRPEPRGLRSALNGDGVDWGVATGQDLLLDVPMTHYAVPESAIEQVVSWVSRNAADAQPSESPRPEPAGVTPSQAIELVAAGENGLTESVRWYGPIGLFGIETAPQTTLRAPVVVITNVAADRHVGPGRQWVELARALGSLGFRVVRLDQSGTGDSPTHPGQSFGQLYARDWLADIPEALDDICRDGSEPVLVGVCSGAYSAMEAAFARPVRAVYAINVILHAAAISRSSSVGDERRRAARTPNRLIMRIGRRRPRPAALLWRLYRQAAVRRTPFAAVRDLLTRGTDIVLVMSHDDGRHFREVLFWAISRRRALRSGRLRHIEDARIDHALMTVQGQRYAIEAVRDDLAARYPLQPAGSPTASVPDRGHPRKEH